VTALGPDLGDRVGQALEPVADHHQHVTGAAVLDLGQHPQPVLRALAVAVLPGPQAHDVALAVGGDAEDDVDGPVGHVAVADLDVDDVDEQHRVNRVQRPGLPLGQALQYPVGDGADGVPGHLRAVDLGQVGLDLAGGQALGDQGDHQVIHARQAPLPLGHDRRGEAGIPIPRHADLHRPRLGEHRFGPVPVAGVPAIPARRVMLLITQLEVAR
jgi:hypothetical protein